jgi:hypothetical protein
VLHFNLKCNTPPWAYGREARARRGTGVEVDSPQHSHLASELESSSSDEEASIEDMLDQMAENLNDAYAEERARRRKSMNLVELAIALLAFRCQD